MIFAWEEGVRFPSKERRKKATQTLIGRILCVCWKGPFISLLLLFWYIPFLYFEGHRKVDSPQVCLVWFSTVYIFFSFIHSKLDDKVSFLLIYRRCLGVRPLNSETCTQLEATMAQFCGWDLGSNKSQRRNWASHLSNEEGTSFQNYYRKFSFKEKDLDQKLFFLKLLSFLWIKTQLICVSLNFGSEKMLALKQKFSF